MGEAGREGNAGEGEGKGGREKSGKLLKFLRAPMVFKNLI